ncbi:hypothetical protein [Xanthomonas arboricola]|uniref:hypothetical protein n=1 Tax=Xanthomonas arboricola TaxID=56448 RepID=UPI00142F95F2|nr:hypothetical protein [Xanthomonas arboricola]
MISAHATQKLALQQGATQQFVHPQATGLPANASNPPEAIAATWRQQNREKSLHIRRLPGSLANEGLEMVAEDGIEPPTRGFSIRTRKSK